MKASDLDRIVDTLSPGAALQSHQRMTGGVSAEVYRLELSLADSSKAEVILRIHGESHNGLPASLEFELLAQLHAQGAKVAAPLWVDDSRTVLEYDYLIITYIEGETGLPANNLEHYLSQMANMLASIHGQSTSGLPELPLRTDPLPEVFEFFENDQAYRDLQTYLQGLKETGYTETPALLHGDFWPQNILWQQGEITAVLDWEDAAIGDPLSDLAGAMLEIRYLFGNDGSAYFRQAYDTLLTIDNDRLDFWQIYVASAALKYMGNWGLEPARESHMRDEADASIREAATRLMGNR